MQVTGQKVILLPFIMSVGYFCGFLQKYLTGDLMVQKAEDTFRSLLHI